MSKLKSAHAKSADTPRKAAPKPGEKSGGATTSHVDLNDDIPVNTQIITYWTFLILTVLGYIYDLYDTWRGKKLVVAKKGYVPLTRDFEGFYRRRIYTRMDYAFNRPVVGPAGGRIKIRERQYIASENTRRADGHRLELTGKVIDCVNLSSYNYLGFAEPGNSETEPLVLRDLSKFGVSTCSAVLLGGATSTLVALESEVASFLGAESALVFGMGWGTNSTAIPALVANTLSRTRQCCCQGAVRRGVQHLFDAKGVRKGSGSGFAQGGGRGTLLISDALNHNSIVIGARSSGAAVRPFRHNDMAQLESIIRKAIINGQPKTHRAWRKIIIVVEGVYSMEGEMCALPQVLALKKKYGCYVYLDEAHSIGAVGRGGRGVTEFFGVQPTDVDLLMGTFTKSFGAIGGYVAGSKHVVNAMRQVCASHIMSSGLSPPCIAQVRATIKAIRYGSGKERIQRLLSNSNYFRNRLRDAGLMVVGSEGNAVIPVIIATPTRMEVMSNMCLQQGIAVVMVCFPATPLLTSRVRFCISAAISKEDLEYAADKVIEIAKLIGMDYFRKSSLSERLSSNGAVIFLSIVSVVGLLAFSQS